MKHSACLLLSAILGLSTYSVASAQSPSESARTGALSYRSGSTQQFTTFHCYPGDLVYFSSSLDSLKGAYTDARGVSLHTVKRIDLSERADASVRRGTIYYGGKNNQLPNVFVYVESCSWSNSDREVGGLNDDAISSVIFTNDIPTRSMPPGFTKLSGSLRFRDGATQDFNGILCSSGHYPSRLHFSEDLVSLEDKTYQNSTGVDIRPGMSLQLGEQINHNVRRGTLRYPDGTERADVYLYVGACRWANNDEVKGTLKDAAITSVVFAGETRNSSP